MIEITTKEGIEQLRNQSAYTIVGAGGDLNEWVNGYQELLQKEEIGEPEKWYKFKGKLLNDSYHLTGKNRYPKDIIFLSFPLTGLNVGKLAMFKLKMEDRWLDDIIDNDLMREDV